MSLNVRAIDSEMSSSPEWSTPEGREVAEKITREFRNCEKCKKSYISVVKDYISVLVKRGTPRTDYYSDFAPDVVEAMTTPFYNLDEVTNNNFFAKVIVKVRQQEYF